MKKLLALVAVVSLISVNGFADYYNWGSQTYSQSTDLIVNSTGDKSTISEFITPTQNLGTNDFIGELAEKNLLATMGYTQALDYNPNAPVKFSADNGSNPYGTPLPTNVSYTPITIMGLEGDPRSAQTVWVPTSQYNALSNQSLNTRETTDATNIGTNTGNISTLQNGLATTNVNVTNNATAITNETLRATGAETTLINDLTQTNTQVNTNTSNIATLGTNLNTETGARIAGDQANAVAITNETVRATGVERGIQNLTDGSVLSNTVNQHTIQINDLNTGLAATNTQVNTNTQSINTLNTGLTATNASLAGTQNMTDDSVITNAVKANTVGLAQTNTQVNNNTANIGNLYTGLNNETVRAQGAEAGLQNQVNATNSKVANLDNRVDKLEQVKAMVDMNVRILDAKKYSVGFFDTWDVSNNRNFAFGARLTYKLGKSYEETQLEKQLKQIEALERVLNKIANQ